MQRTRCPWQAGLIVVALGLLIAPGCHHTPVDNSELTSGPAPLRMPAPAQEGEGSCCYEDSLTGGHIFEMYCGYCHNARALAERPFSNYKNVAQHMRVRANITGEEYAKLLAWLRRWHDVPPPHPPVEPSPKRFFFSQPIQELREKPPAQEAAAPQPQQPAGNDNAESLDSAQKR